MLRFQSFPEVPALQPTAELRAGHVEPFKLHSNDKFPHHQEEQEVLLHEAASPCAAQQLQELPGESWPWVLGHDIITVGPLSCLPLAACLLHGHREEL